MHDIQQSNKRYRLMHTFFDPTVSEYQTFNAISMQDLLDLGAIDFVLLLALFAFMAFFCEIVWVRKVRIIRIIRTIKRKLSRNIKKGFTNLKILNRTRQTKN